MELTTVQLVFSIFAFSTPLFNDADGKSHRRTTDTSERSLIVVTIDSASESVSTQVDSLPQDAHAKNGDAAITAAQCLLNPA